MHHAEFVHANPGDAASGGVTREARYPDAHHRLTAIAVRTEELTASPSALGVTDHPQCARTREITFAYRRARVRRLLRSFGDGGTDRWRPQVLGGVTVMTSSTEG